MILKRCSSAPSRLRATLVAGLLLLCSVVAKSWLTLGLPLPVCNLRAWTGLPCGTCGTTRMLESLLRGDVASAFAWNPFVFLLLALIIAWSVASVLCACTGFPGYRLVFEGKERRYLAAFVAVAFLLSWGYLVGYGV